MNRRKDDVKSSMILIIIIINYVNENDSLCIDLNAESFAKSIKSRVC
jgi:hypothetical protein